MTYLFLLAGERSVSKIVSVFFAKETFHFSETTLASFINGIIHINYCYLLEKLLVS